MKYYLLKYKKLFIINIIFSIALAFFDVGLAFVLKMIIDSASNKDINKLKSVIIFSFFYIIFVFIWSYSTKISQCKKTKGTP